MSVPSPVRYQSSRGTPRGCDFRDVLLSAYAPDGGLWVPELETMPSDVWSSLRVGMTVAEVTARVLHPFTGLALPTCEALCAKAFRSFNGGREPSLPLVRVGGRLFLETGAGPTLAFKDIGQQVVAQLLDHILGEHGESANIVVETSGDTGPAAIEAVRSCEHVRIFCLYPEGRVSEVQELQMITVDSPNVHVYRTEGDTDEQAEALKILFEDGAFMRRHRVCSINSINFARVLVQSAYYLWACLQLDASGGRDAGGRDAGGRDTGGRDTGGRDTGGRDAGGCDGCSAINFVVPTGAFGNAAGGLLAARLGAPIGRIVCATNANDIVHRTLASGDMRMTENRQTVSPAMDIQFAYNMERLLYFSTEGDVGAVGAIMRQLEASRAVVLPPALLTVVQRRFVSCTVTDAQTLQAMREVYAADGYALDPHSAVGVYALDHDAAVRAACARQPTVCVLTAHPAKFGEAVCQAGLPKSVCDDARVEALRALPRDRFTYLRDPGRHTRREKLRVWAREIRLAVEGLGGGDEGDAATNMATPENGTGGAGGGCRVSGGAAPPDPSTRRRSKL